MNALKTILCFHFLLVSCYIYSQGSYKKTGYASFYHDLFEGRKTANGEIFRQKKMTCAHRTLPFGTRLKVTNLDNQKSVLVTVNDRGPYYGGRIIDLSRAAAKKLDFITEGTTLVHLEIISSEDRKDTLFVTNDTVFPFYKVEILDTALSCYTLKIASYLSEEKALEVAKELQQELDREVFIQMAVVKKKLMFRLFTGNFSSKEEAEELAQKIKTFYPDCYVVELAINE